MCTANNFRKKHYSPSGNRTRAFHVTGGDNSCNQALFDLKIVSNYLFIRVQEIKVNPSLTAISHSVGASWENQASILRRIPQFFKTTESKPFWNLTGLFDALRLHHEAVFTVYYPGNGSKACPRDLRRTDLCKFEKTGSLPCLFKKLREF